MPYKTNNNLNSKQIFLNRATYLVKADEERVSNSATYENFVNFHFAEKQLYGRVGRNFVPISIVDLFNNIKRIPSPNNDLTEHRAACFVVDQFNEMKKQFNKCQLIGKISPNEEFLSNLVVYKSYTPPDPLYRSYYRDNAPRHNPFYSSVDHQSDHLPLAS